MSDTSVTTTNSSKNLRTTAAHQGFTLVGFGFLIFELGFLVLYSNEFWFERDISMLGIPAAMLALFVAHMLLIGLESKWGCNFFSPLWKRRPPVVYRQWVLLDESGLEPGLTFGQRHVIWKVIDEVELTIWGNLRILSRALSGAASDKPSSSKMPFFKPVTAEEILKIPFGVAGIGDQKQVIEAMQQNNPNLLMNERLKKRLAQKDVRGTVLVQQLGALFLVFVLMDVGVSMYVYLEMLKNYYLCERTGSDIHRDTRKMSPYFFNQAEAIRQRSMPLSWVSTKIMREGKVASGVFQTRAEALWTMGKRDDAIESMQKALKLAPSFRLNLKLARMLALNGRRTEAEEQLKKVMEEKDSALLPRLYMLALSDSDQRGTLYKVYLHDLDDNLFGSDLMWPPGSHVFTQDVFYRDDLTFIFDKVLNTDTSGIRGTDVKSKPKSKF